MAGNSTDFRIGKRLKQRRIELKLIQQDIAKVTRVTFQQIHKYETAKTPIPASTLYQISELLDVPIAYFFEIEE